MGSNDNNALWSSDKNDLQISNAKPLKPLFSRKVPWQAQIRGPRDLTYQKQRNLALPNLQEGMGGEMNLHILMLHYPD